MAKRGYIIPNDWNGTDYHLWMFCAPASQNWDATFRGALYDLTRGRSWDETTGSIVDTQKIAMEAYRTMTICDDLVAALNGIEQAIVGLNSGASACSCEGGSEISPDPSDGTVTIGPGGRFPDQTTYDTAKCNASNAIYDQIDDTNDKLKVYNVDTLGSGGVALAVSLVTTLILSGPVGWGIAVVLGVVSALVSLLLSSASFSLTDISIIWKNNHQDLVCALYNATDTAEAQSEIQSIITTAGATTFEQNYIAILTTDKLINQLYDDMEDSVENYVSPNPIDCSVCPEPASCELGFDLNPDETPRGTGDLTKNGQSRVLTATQYAGNNIWYVAFKVGLPEDTGNYYSDCSGMPAECVGTGDEWVTVNVSNVSVTPNSSAGAKCDNGSHSLVWSGAGGPPGGDLEVSWMEIINNTQQFTVTLTIT